jgi:hypothetical protein
LNEYRARNISLIFIAIEAIFAFLLIGLIFIGMELSELSIQGAKPSLGLIVFLLIFLGLGILIVLSAFNKLFFYLLTVIEICLTFYLLIISAFFIILIYLSLIILAPYVFYYIAKIRCRF